MLIVSRAVNVVNSVIYLRAVVEEAVKEERFVPTARVVRIDPGK